MPAPLHLIKLSVGADDLADHADWQRRLLARHGAVFHVTRMTPKRADEIRAGGSLYWVIKGEIAARQRVLCFTPVVEGGVPACRIALDPPLVPVLRRRQRPFQGWRYLRADAAPADLPKGTAALPQELQRVLADLGLL